MPAAASASAFAAPRRARRIARGAAMLAALALALSACARLPADYAPAARAAAPMFDPFVFFAGPSASTGTRWRRLRADLPVRTTSFGEIVPLTPREANFAAPTRGVLVIEQTLQEDEEPPRTRFIELRKVGEGRYDGRISDSLGLVDGYVQGNRFTLQYTLRGNYDVTQTWTLAPDGRSAEAVTRVLLLGVPMAVFTEEFVKGDAPAEIGTGEARDPMRAGSRRYE